MHSVPLIVSTHDLRRLEALLDSPLGAQSPMAPLLEQELLRAEVREPAEIPADVVTMNSEVACIDERSGRAHRVRLVYPHQADASRGCVSVLAPVGTALLGLAVGSSIDWPLPGGRASRVRVTALAYQPEAKGRPG